MAEIHDFPKAVPDAEPTRETKLSDEIALSLLKFKQDGTGADINTTPGQNEFVEKLAKEMTDQAPRTDADIAARALAQLALAQWRGMYTVANEAGGARASAAKKHLRTTAEDIYRNYIIATGLRLVDERTMKEKRGWLAKKIEWLRVWWASL